MISLVLSIIAAKENKHKEVHDLQNHMIKSNYFSIKYSYQKTMGKLPWVGRR